MTYVGSGDPPLADYYPAWLDKLADDVTLEGSMMDGFVQGAEAAVLSVDSQCCLRRSHAFADEAHVREPNEETR